MTGTLNIARRWVLAAAAAALVLTVFAAGSARAATYPAPGGSTFSGGLEGWKVTKSSCTLPLGLCNTDSGYDANNGNPAGSLRSETSILLNLLNLFKGEAVFESPSFTVTDSGAGVVSLQRAFSNTNLVKLAPQLQYTVSLVDKSLGTTTEAVAETLNGESTFLAKQGVAPLIAGHTYAIVIAATTGSTAELLGITGAARALFDNVSLTTSKSDDGGSGGGAGGGSGSGGSGGNGAGGSGGSGGNAAAGKGAGGKNSNSLSNSRLRLLISKGATAAPVALRGNRLFVKVNCPAKIGRACRITAQGMLNRRKPATTKRVVKVGKGKGKRIVLRVKRKAKKQVAKRKRLLVRQQVRAGKAHTTIYKNRKLIRQR